MEWLKINCLSTELHSSSIPWAIVFPLACWTIWKNRNSVCFEPTPSNPLKPTWTIAMAIEWYHLSNTSKPRVTKIIACSWNSPLIHCFKLNTDGATNENHAAAGDIIRDNHGNWVSGFCRFLDKTNSLTTELWALRDGLKLALDMGLTPIDVESDALTLVHMVLNNCNDQHHLSNIVHDCKFLLDSLRSPKLYKGWLRDGSTVLVKCLKLKQKYSHQNLQQNMDVISKLRHRHLVCVLGHCTVTYQDHPNAACTVFIVLEHVANGSLRDHLKEWIKREYLKWPQRMAISIGIARGIQFLHTGIAPGLFGNDLKIENILLDESLTAKISTYNISLPSKVCSESPLNDNSNRLDSIENPEKNDVYQLGIILLEIITSKPITSDRELHELKLQLERTLAESPSKLQEAIDPSIRGTFAYESLKTVVEITMKCLCEDSSTRPTIEDVLWHLQYSIQVQDGWNSSGNLSEKM